MADDQSGLHLLADVCIFQEWVWSAPLIPLDFPRKKRSFRRKSGGRLQITATKPLVLKISQTGLGKRCHFKVDGDDDSDDGYDRKGKKKMKQSISMGGGSGIVSTSHGVFDPRVTQISHLKMLMGPNPNPKSNPPRLFMERIRELGGSQVEFVMEKTLSATDLKKDQNRLSMPFKQIQSDFLTAREKLVLNTKEDDGKHYKGIDVMVIQPSLHTSTLCLKKWDYKSSSFSYVFIKNWSKLASDSGLEPGMVLQIWSFRVNNALCFALVNHSQEKPATL